MTTISAPTYTQIPNAILDNLGSFEEVELTVILFICRQTFGWHKTKARITLERLISGTGRSNGQINVAITKLVKDGLIKKTASHRNGNEYEIVLDHEEPVLQPPENSSPTTGEPVLQPPENPIKERKILKKDSDEPSAPVVSFRTHWCSEYPNYHEEAKYVFQGAKDGLAIKRLLGAGMSPEHLMRIAIAAWQQPDGFNTKAAASISGFASRINEIRADLNSSRTPKRQTEPLRNQI